MKTLGIFVQSWLGMHGGGAILTNASAIAKYLLHFKIMHVQIMKK